jgi:DNA-binding MarR family transcriptional regulator
MTDSLSALGTSTAPADQVQLSPPAQLAGRLRRAIVLLRRQVRREDPPALTIAQLSALATVVRCGPLGVGQLAEAEVLPSPAVTRLADRLEEAGLVARQPNPADRRGVLLVATDAGRELTARREEASNAWMAERLKALPVADRLALERAVEVLESLVGDRDTDKEVQR